MTIKNVNLSGQGQVDNYHRRPGTKSDLAHTADEVGRQQNPLAFGWEIMAEPTLQGFPIFELLGEAGAAYISRNAKDPRTWDITLTIYGEETLEPPAQWMLLSHLTRMAKNDIGFTAGQ